MSHHKLVVLWLKKGSANAPHPVIGGPFLLLPTGRLPASVTDTSLLMPVGSEPSTPASARGKKSKTIIKA